MWGLFPGITSTARANPIRPNNLRNPSHSHWPRKINLVPIDYAFRPRLRGRLTLLRLALSKEPLGYRRQGFSPCLSLLMSSFSLLKAPPHLTVEASMHAAATGVGARRRSYRALLNRTLRYRRPKATRSFGSWLEPRYIFAAGQLA